jgi:ABC-type proline/glycine betaine transport system substrate-binding protein
MEQNDASLEETALWFLQEYQDLWKGWLENHPQAMLKVEAAL